MPAKNSEMTKFATKSVATRPTNIASTSRSTGVSRSAAEARTTEVRKGKRARAPADSADAVFDEGPPAKKHAPARRTNIVPQPKSLNAATSSKQAGPSKPTNPTSKRATEPAPLSKHDIKLQHKICGLVDEMKDIAERVVMDLVVRHNFVRHSTHATADEEACARVRKYVGAEVEERLRTGEHQDDPRWIAIALKAVISAEVFYAINDYEVGLDTEDREELRKRKELERNIL